jgi:hypothetical protein
MNYKELLRKGLEKHKPDPLPKHKPVSIHDKRRDMLKVCEDIKATKPVPGYAKAGYRKMVQRFHDCIPSFQGMIDDLNEADWSSGSFPIVGFPTSDFAKVRGKVFEKPKNSVSMPPLERAEQPIHWEDEGDY